MSEENTQENMDRLAPNPIPGQRSPDPQDGLDDPELTAIAAYLYKTVYSGIENLHSEKIKLQESLLPLHVE